MQDTLTKNELIKQIGQGLKALGYSEIEETEKTLDGCNALFYKQFDDLILTLGLELSTRYKERFTASYYLSPSFNWGYMPPGFPIRAYQRVGHFLTNEQRLRLLDAFFNAPGVIDAWWNGFQADVVNNFLEAVQLSEPCFLEQPGLKGEILSCEKIIKYMDMISKTISLSNTLQEIPSGLAAQPKRHLAKISTKFYWAAELVLITSKPESVSSSFVQLLAVDSWRCEALKKQA